MNYKKIMLANELQQNKHHETLRISEQTALLHWQCDYAREGSILLTSVCDGASIASACKSQTREMSHHHVILNF